MPIGGILYLGRYRYRFQVMSKSNKHWRLYIYILYLYMYQVKYGVKKTQKADLESQVFFILLSSSGY